MKLSEKAEKQRETSCKVSRCLCGESVLGAIEEGHDLGPGAAVAGAERGVRCAVGHAVLHGPGHSLGVEIAGRHVGEAVHRGGGGAHGAIEEGHVLAPGAGIAGAEQAIGLAVGDAQLLGPLHGVEVIGVGGHVNEGAGLPRLDEGRLDLHLTVGHSEGVLAVALVGQLELIAAGVLDGEFVQLVALIGGHGDGHAVALGGVLGADGHIAVLGAGDGHRVAAATGR